MEDKREIRRRYKEAPQPAGVYVIRNTEDGSVYLGGSLNLQGAMNRDRFELQQGTHRNAELLSDWKRLGAEKFEFEVVDTLKPSNDPAVDPKAELETALQLWREEFRTAGTLGYSGR